MKISLRAGLVATILLAPMVSGAQDMADGMKYDSMNINRAGFMRIETNSGQIERITDGANIELLSVDSKTPSLRLVAQEISFEWPKQGGSMPDTLILEGNARVEHAIGVLTAQRVVWNRRTGLLVFTGKPVLKSDKFGELHGEKMEYNPETGTFDVYEGSATGVPLRGTGGTEIPSSPALLSASDVRDWPGLLRAFKDGADSDTPSPARHITGLLDSEAREFFTSMDTTKEPGDGIKQQMLKQINELLGRADFYDKAAWSGVTLSPEARKLVDSGGNLGKEQRLERNRRLFDAAFPAIARPLPLSEGVE